MSNNQVVNHYLNSFEMLKDVALFDLRKHSLEMFIKDGLPQKKWEEYQYTPVSLLSKEYKVSTNLKDISHSVEYNDPNELTIDCINGEMNFAKKQEVLSSLGIYVSDLQEALEKNIVRLPVDSDPMKKLNHTFFNKGIHIRVGSECRLEKPIYIRHLITENNILASPLVVLELEPTAKLKLHEIYSPNGMSSLSNSCVFIHMLKNSTLSYYKESSGFKEDSLVNGTIIRQDEGSCLEWLHVSTGGALIRENLNVDIHGENCISKVNALSLLKENKVCDHNLNVSHHVGSSTSRQYVKSILKDQAHAIFKGKIFIAKEAQKTQSSQLSKNLLLDDKAKVDTKPQLSVFADDVKANHGAAIGRINAEEKFYLESRGLSPDVVSRMLCRGYALDAISTIETDTLKDDAMKFIDKELETYI